MKKKIKVKSIVILSIILIAVSFCTVDTIRASNKKAPLFCIITSQFKDGGSTNYLGFGYSINKSVNEELFQPGINAKYIFDWYVNFLYIIPVKVCSSEK